MESLLVLLELPCRISFAVAYLLEKHPQTRHELQGENRLQNSVVATLYQADISCIQTSR